MNKTPTQIAVVTAIDPLIRSTVALILSDISPILTCDLTDTGVQLEYTVGMGDESAKLDDVLPGDLSSLSATVEVILEHPCITCSLRQAIIPFLQQRQPENVILLLPPGVDSASLVPTLADETFEQGWQVTSVTHVCEADALAEELLTHIPVEERGLALFAGDERCLGELQLTNLAYSDIVVSLGESADGLAVLKHFLPDEAHFFDTVVALDFEILFATEHDIDAALTRVHPATTNAWAGGGTNRDAGNVDESSQFAIPIRETHESDVGQTGSAGKIWTLDLFSNQPFHPERLVDQLSELCPEGVCVRGCFWLPARPQTVCALNAHGGVITVGSAGQWDVNIGFGNAHTHLIVTGNGPRPSGIETAFWSSLVETAEVFSVGNDGLDEWFE